MAISDHPSLDEAHGFLRHLKMRTEQAGKPQLYKKFKDAIRKRRNQRQTVLKLTKQISNLLHDYPDVLLGFNRFLLPGDQITVDLNAFLDQQQSQQQQSIEGESPATAANVLLSLVDGSSAPAVKSNDAAESQAAPVDA